MLYARQTLNRFEKKLTTTVSDKYRFGNYGHYNLNVYIHVLDSHKHEEMMKMKSVFINIASAEQQSYSVISTQTANGFLLNVVDFNDLGFEADNIQFGLDCIQNTIKERCIGYCPPAPTPCTDLVLSVGEFVLMVTI